MVNVNIRSFNLDGSPRRELELPLPNMKNRFSTPPNFEEMEDDTIQEDDAPDQVNFPLMTSINLGISLSKYEVKSNGSPIRKNKRKESNESFEKLLRAPMKANCVNSKTEAGLFLAEK